MFHAEQYMRVSEACCTVLASSSLNSYTSEPFAFAFKKVSMYVEYTRRTASTTCRKLRV
jgi:hypothetical protein